MKKICFAIAILISNIAMAQSFGIKVGLNYNANGDYIESLENVVDSPDRNIGYHIGLFGKFGDQLYFRPELVYTATKSDYSDGSFDMKKLDAPLLVGLKVIGPVSVFGGPSLQYILDSDFDDISIDEVESDFTVGLNFGVAVQLNKLGLDLRYERGFNDNEAEFITNNNINATLDTRPDQLIFSVSYTL